MAIECAKGSICSLKRRAKIEVEAISERCKMTQLAARALFGTMQLLVSPGIGKQPTGSSFLGSSDLKKRKPTLNICLELPFSGRYIS